MTKLVCYHTWITHLFALACLSSAILGAKGQFQQVYYVTPEGVPCSYSPCFDLGTYLSNQSKYFVSNTQFVFLSGQHILSQNLGINHAKNVELVGYGPMTTHSIAENVLSYGFDPYEQDSTITYTSSSSVIHCNETKNHISIFWCDSIALVNLTIIDCGYIESISNRGQAVYFHGSWSIMIDGISIQNAHGYGIYAILSGPMNISRSSFIGNNQYVKNMLQKRTVPCSTAVQNCTITEYWNDGTVDPSNYDGGGVIISFLTSAHTIFVSSSIFSLSLDARYGAASPGLRTSGTGLSLDMTSKGGVPTYPVMFSNITFYRNQADLGAGIQLYNLFYNYPGSISVLIDNILFMSGVALQGAGMSYASITRGNRFSHSVSTVISNTKFCNNYAYNYGSSMSIHVEDDSIFPTSTLNTLNMYNCAFQNEYGNSSADISISQFSIAVININNTVWKQMYQTQLVTFSSGSSNRSLLSITLQNSKIMGTSAMLSLANGSLYMYNCTVNALQAQYSFKTSNEVLVLSTYNSFVYINNCYFSGLSTLTGIMQVVSCEMQLVNISLMNSLHVSTLLSNVSIFGKVLLVNDSSLLLASSLLQAENGSSLQLASSILKAENGSSLHLVTSAIQTYNGSSIQLNSSILQSENGSSVLLVLSTLQAKNGSSLLLNSSLLQAENDSSLQIVSSILQAENISSLKLVSSILHTENGSSLLWASSILQAENDSFLKLASSTLKAENTTIHLSGALVTAISFIDSNATFVLAEITCNNHTALKGGALYLESSSLVFINSSATFIDNQADLGGGLYLLSSNVSFISSNLNCSSNIARYFGGCLYLLSSIVSFQNTTDVLFFNNIAFNAGGGMFLVSQSKLNLTAPSHITFLNNSASLTGGAIYSEDNIVSPKVAQPQCFLNLTYSNEFASEDSSISLYFYANNAPAGSVLFGGNIDTCTPVTITAKRDLNDVFVVKSTLTNDTSTFSSTPLYLCNCSSSNSSNSCTPITSINATLYPGQILSVPFVAVGQRNGTAPSVIIPVVGPIDSKFIVLSPILTDAGKGVCRNYTLPYYRSGVPVTIMTQAAYSIGDLPVSNFTITVTLLSCPTGFIVNETSDSFTANASCQCDPRLNHVVSECIIANLTIQKSVPSFWIGSMPNNSLVYSHCLPEFCNASLAFLPMQQDEQCLNGHVGVACTSCPRNYSITLGVPMCRMCSNYYLMLVIAFFATGLFCVFLLFALNLTVSVGTINGVLWYAFVVNLNRVIFVKNNSLVNSIFFIFVSWIDFDFGIVVCFYDGMDMYWYTWLQLVFPTFIFLIIGAIVLCAKCSQTVSKLCKPNAVPVLATLSYMALSKLMRTCVVALYPNQLSFANGNQWVWLYDATMPYLDRWHVVLAGVCALILDLVIIPYTALLVLSPWLQKYSQKRCVSWINMLKPFLDNYQAPYKDRFRYWAGALFAFRIVFCVVTAACTSTSNSKIVLVAIIIAHVSIILGAGIAVYKNWVLSVLESFFHINLSVMAALMLLYEDDEDSATIVVWIGVGSYLVSVVGIIVYHIACKVCPSRCGRKIPEANDAGAAEEEREELLYDDKGINL